MRNLLSTVLLLCFCFLSITGQEKYTISGYLKDASSKEGLIGATVYVNELATGTASNAYGFYSLTLQEGVYNLSFNYLGYDTQEKEITLNKDFDLNVFLEEFSSELGEVVVTDTKLKAIENVERAQVGIVDLQAKELKELPALGGEKDILKALVLLPGVQSGSEGTAGFYVRGGGPDQNLILLDEAVVYNPYHLFGFLSVFNVDAIKNVSLIKGGYPAKFGGRLSSILDISMKDGDMSSFHGEGGIGTVFSRLTLEGPILKDKASLLVSGRRTYLDQLIKAVVPADLEEEIPQLFFYDLNAKFNYKFSDKDRIFLSAYNGRDQFQVDVPSDSVAFRVPWGNTTATIRWNHLFSNKLFANTSLIFNDYEFKFEFTDDIENIEVGIKTGIRDYNAKLDFDYFPNIDHLVKFGGQFTQHQFTPSISQALLEVEEIEGIEQDTTIQFNNQVIDVQEGAIYVSDEWRINNTVSVQGGLRMPFFIADSVNYVRLEPRLIAKVSLSEGSSLKGSFTVMNQFVHLVTNSGVSFPWDVWIPSSNIIKPKRATQVSAGYFRNFFDNTYEFSAEGYYKKMENLIEYQEGASILSQQNIEDQVTFGDGWSYGAELFIRKRTGRVNGWIGYTWSKSDRKFDDLNGGRTFAAKYDRRHDLSVVAFYDLNENWSFTGVLVYGSGHSLTLATGDFLDNQQFTERNGFKLKAYNRFDLGLKYVAKPDAKFQSIFRFDIYNVFNRRNPYFLTLTERDDPFSQGDKNVITQISLLPMIPAFSWNFKF